MAKHNKKRNTAFIYEALVREIVKQSVAKNNEKRNAAIQIMKEAFAPRTELSLLHPTSEPPLSVPFGGL